LSPRTGEVELTEPLRVCKAWVLARLPFCAPPGERPGRTARRTGDNVVGRPVPPPAAAASRPRVCGSGEAAATALPLSDSGASSAPLKRPSSVSMAEAFPSMSVPPKILKSGLKFH